MQWMPAATLSLDALCELWNEAYAGYLYPVSQTPDMFRQMINTGSIRLDQSVLLEVDGALAGLSFLGVRQDRGWIGGFGITPVHRGRGLARPLIEEQLAWAWRLGLASVQLEVLAKNTAAKRVYERAGFAVEREVAILGGAAGSYPAARQEGARALTPPAGRALLSRLQGRSRPTWQREAASLAEAADVTYLAVGEAGALAFAARPTAIRVLDLATADDADQREVAHALLTALAAAAGERPVMVVNEPEGALLGALLQAGLQEMDRQYEMAIYSASGDSPRRSLSA